MRKIAYVEDWGICPECRQPLSLETIRCLAGHYVGCWCSCNLYESQESGLFSSHQEAENALVSWMEHEKVPIRWKEPSF